MDLLVRQFEYEVWQPRNDLESKTQIKYQNPALGSDFIVSGHQYNVQRIYPRDYIECIVCGDEFVEGFNSVGDYDDYDWNRFEPGEDYTLSGTVYGQDYGEIKDESDTLVFMSDHDPNMDYNNYRDDKEKETDGGREGGIGSFNHKALSLIFYLFLKITFRGFIM